MEEDYASFMEGYRNLKTLEWMRSLKSDGFKIGILTNMPPSMAPRFRRVFALQFIDPLCDCHRFAASRMSAKIASVPSTPFADSIVLI